LKWSLTTNNPTGKPLLNDENFFPNVDVIPRRHKSTFAGNHYSKTSLWFSGMNWRAGKGSSELRFTRKQPPHIDLPAFVISPHAVDC
jgi:hypothetical protein